MRKLVPILPRGRKLRVLDLCSGSCTLLDALQEYLPTIRQRFEYVSIDPDPQVGSPVDGHVHICRDVRDGAKSSRRATNQGILTSCGRRPHVESSHARRRT